MDLGQNPPSPSHPPCAVNLHSLPVELLAYIFTFCTQAPDKPYLHYPAALIAITHVCHYWRTLALSYAPLWTSVTCGTRLPLHWIKASMERSQPMLMDFDLQILPWDHTKIIPLLSDFTRVRSLCLKGSRHTIHPILDSLCSPLPIQSLSLCLKDIESEERKFILSDDLFGGMAPSIRCIQFDADCRIVAPHWLLRGVTHFTSTEPISPSELLDVLRQMPALTYLDFRPLSYQWGKLDADLSPIQMPQLTNLIVHTNGYPHTFLPLNQLLLLPADAKRRLELHLSRFCGWIARLEDWTGLSPLLDAADRFQHIHFSGEHKEGWFRMWTGGAATTWEDAEFCLFAEWKDDFGDSGMRTSRLASQFVEVCGALGVARARRLAVHLTAVDWRKFKKRQNDLSESYWWKLLEKLPGIEELELYLTGVGASGGGVWKVSTAPAVLPALRRVRVVAPELDQLLAQYAIIGDSPARRIVRLPNSTEGDIASFPEAVSAEKDLENLSSGLLEFLQGLAG
jgi:hypothetical protein